MSKRLGLDALLTERRLRELAGKVYFQRGANYFANGAVTGLQMNGGRLAASVRGTRRYGVRLWAEGRSLEWSCTCPLGEEGELCKHVVAAGLEWLRNGAHEQPAPAADAEPVELDAFLRRLDHEGLVRLILERAGEDDALDTWLLAKAQSKGLRRPKAVLRAIEQAFEVDGFVDYRDAPTYVSRVQQAVFLLEATLAGGDFAAALDLSEHALRLGFSAFEQVDDSDGALGEVMRQIAEMHRRACAGRVSPGPQLAERLFALIMDDHWGIVDVTGYRRALGRDGLQRFREVVRREWDKLPVLGPDSRSRNDESGKRYLLTQLMQQIVVSGSDVDAQVDIERRDLSYPGAFLRIAELLKKARRHDEALAWAERGVQIFPGRARDALREFLIAEYQRRKQFDRALALRWDDFEKYPGFEAYRSLEHCARAASAWAAWRSRALDLLQSKAASSDPRGRWGTDASSALTEIHLTEGDRASALAQARAGGCSQALWFRLAAACEGDAPGDAVAIYLGQLDYIIDGRGNYAYDQAAQLLSKIGKLMHRQGQAARFLDVLAGVQTRHKAKRNLMQRLERVAAEARKRGPGR